jgi:hypothetical protein
MEKEHTNEAEEQLRGTEQHAADAEREEVIGVGVSLRRLNPKG